MPLALHDVVDAEALVAWIIRLSGLTFSNEDAEDAQQHLLLEVWRLSLEFDPAGGHALSSSRSTMPSEIEWTQLSPRGAAIARKIGSRLSDGYTKSEIAIELGTTSSWVSAMLRELRAELVD